MAAVVSNPSSLTKDKLKKELSRHNVTLPSPDSRKDVYVQLYKTHVLRPDLDRQRSEFSSDEEDGLGSPTSTRKQQISPTKKILLKLKPQALKQQAGSMDIDVFSLSDSDLASLLRKHGVNVGPILESTRKVYQRKLEKLLKMGGDAAPVANGNSESEEDYSDKEEEEPEPEPVAPQRPEPVRRRVVRDPPQPKPSPRKPFVRDEVESYGNQSNDIRQGSNRAARYTSKVITSTAESSTSSVREMESFITAQDMVTQVHEEQQQEEEEVDVESEATPNKPSKGISIWVQIVILLVVVLIVFLIFQSMDPAGISPAKRQLAAEV